MSAVGIISEYNPFHKGHAYHIQQAKKVTGADYAVVVMNGDFMQRGEPAVFDKYTRTALALEGGADIIFELPVRFGISSAGDFAYGGILALQSLGFVDSICFGSEAGDLATIQQAADILTEETQDYRARLKALLHQGMAFPAARALAFNEITELPSGILSAPNNILAIEYCIALNRLNSSIQPFTINRIGQDYHAREEEKGYPSATALRKELKFSDTPHLCLDDFSSVIGYALLSREDLTCFKDISPDLSDRIKKLLPDYRLAERFVNDCYNPSLTKGRIRRAMLQCLLGIRETEKSMPYLRLLGMKKEASSLLAHQKDTSCKILSRLAVDSRQISLKANSLLNQDIFAADLYRQIWCHKYQISLPNEYQHSPIIL